MHQMQSAGRAAPAADGTLPHGDSHWARLPAEPWWRRGQRRLLRAESNSLDCDTSDMLWREVFESEWPGDLTTLPHLPDAALLSLASRRMLDRMRVAGVPLQPRAVQRLAVRQRWDDVLDFGKPELVAELAARGSAVSLLEELVDDRKLVSVHARLVEAAAAEGQLDMVKWLRGRMPDAEWPPSAINWAAGGCCLDLVAWLLENTPSECTARAVTKAVLRGDMHMVEWLAAHTQAGCTVEAFKFACWGGHALHLDTLKWVKEHRPGTMRLVSIDSIVEHGDVEAVAWCLANIDCIVGIFGALQIALEHNNVRLVEYLVTKQGHEDHMFECGEHSASTDALGWPIRHDSRLAPIMARGFAVSGKTELVEWMHVRHPSSVSRSTFEAAIGAKNSRMVEYLLNHIDGVDWNLKFERRLSAQHGLDAVAALSVPVVELLPVGASHWDRLPPELRRMVNAHLRPTLQLFQGIWPLCEAEVRSITPRLCEQLWTEVFRTNWLGNFDRLPHLDPASPVWLHVSSRDMVNHIVKFELPIDPVLLQRLVIRTEPENQADSESLKDPVGCQKRRALATAMACEGKLDELKALFASSRIIRVRSDFICEAAAHGQLEVVKYLRSLSRDARWPPNLMGIAASSGDMELVAWLDKNGCPCSPAAIDQAAGSGSVRIVRFLAEARGQVCTVQAFAAAFRNGHDSMLDFLRAKFPTVFEATTAETFELSNHTCSLRWLKKHRPELVCPEMLKRTIAAGNLSAVMWLVEIGGISITPALFHLALGRNHTDIVEWMMTAKGFTIKSKVFGGSFHGCNTDTLAWLIAREGGSRTGVMVNKFAASGKDKLVEWMHKRFPGCITQRTLYIAICVKNQRLVSLLVELHRGTTVLDFDEAVKLASVTNAGDQISGLLADAKNPKAGKKCRNQRVKSPQLPCCGSHICGEEYDSDYEDAMSRLLGYRFVLTPLPWNV
ncbi:hypothetical protein HK105_204594 [Polyrhizophydium stewartii]|uniref:Ankyrin repeat protein n=1 Tax=Polyrhizophydium stewartii TaxID=2732419 RepID=A0ABR4N8M8_9FUNG